MPFVEWKLGLEAPWTQSLRLQRLSGAADLLELVVTDAGADRWRLTFRGVCAARLTSYDLAASLLNKLPGSGGLFEVIDSSWLRELTATASSPVEARHFVVCCQEAIVEVLARACHSDAMPTA